MRHGSLYDCSMDTPKTIRRRGLLSSVPLLIGLSLTALAITLTQVDLSRTTPPASNSLMDSQLRVEHIMSRTTRQTR
jgi:hypothetical protein